MHVRGIISALLVSAALVSGCDFLRAVAGRPSSAEVAAVRERVALEKAAREKAVADSVAAVEAALKRQADSLAAIETLRTVPGLAFTRTSLGGIYGAAPAEKYIIIVGAFANPAYASKKAASCEKDGYSACIVHFRSGLRSVGICMTDDPVMVTDTLEKLRGAGVCPPKAWILINE